MIAYSFPSNQKDWRGHVWFDHVRDKEKEGNTED
jgi:hypothetical protein